MKIYVKTCLAQRTYPLTGWTGLSHERITILKQSLCFQFSDAQSVLAHEAGCGEGGGVSLTQCICVYWQSVSSSNWKTEFSFAQKWPIVHSISYNLTFQCRMQLLSWIRLPSGVVGCVVWWKFTDVSKVSAASIISAIAPMMEAVGTSPWV
jgi:hypothetical protein